MRRFGLTLLVLALVCTAAPLFAQGDPEGTVIARLRGFEEVPAISSTGGGGFTARINEAGTVMDWELTYGNVEAPVTQAHIHFAQRGVNGGIMVFLCSNLGNGPVGTQACPARSGSVSGSLRAADMVAGAAAQGITPGEFHSLLRAIRAGAAYVNVHSETFPGGEIRAQLIFIPASQ
jgi:hypothetical protein